MVLRRRQHRRTVENNKRSNQQKSNFASAAHFFCSFLCRCFARVQRETSRNFFMEKMSYVLSFTFFSLSLIFSLHWWPLSFLILSPPLQNFHVGLPTKKMSRLCFISRSRSLSPFFSLSFDGLPLCLFFSVFLLLYIPNLWT